ncbi:MAG: hypothetical protein FWD66_11620 [Paludibacter sp.]|nr:hypothetical protein [Paludibacter sp.]
MNMKTIKDLELDNQIEPVIDIATIEVDNLNSISNQSLLELLDNIKGVNLGKYCAVKNHVIAKYGSHYWNAFVIGWLIMDEETRKRVLYLIDMNI